MFHQPAWPVNTVAAVRRETNDEHELSTVRGNLEIPPTSREASEHRMLLDIVRAGSSTEHSDYDVIITSREVTDKRQRLFTQRARGVRSEATFGKLEWIVDR